MESDLEGRLRNTHLPTYKAMIPLYEAIVNSIQSCEDRSERDNVPLNQFKISITILRDEREPTFDDGKGRIAELPIVKFLISDDGIGFNNANWDSFCKLDSSHKKGRSGRGIGRLMWLKAFEKAEVRSQYIEDDTCRVREFTFDSSFSKKTSGGDDFIRKDKDLTSKSTVILENFLDKYASRLRTHNQNSTVAASAIADMNTFGHRS